jgi:hypothetical protein
MFFAERGGIAGGNAHLPGGVHDARAAEAEEQLNQLGTPVPTAMPAPPPRSGAGKGCLIALIVALIPLAFILILVALKFFGIYADFYL